MCLFLSETCPPSSIFTCFHEPCQFAECPAVPDATCTNDYCLGCNAVFTDSRGRKLTEKECNEGKAHATQLVVNC